MPCRAKKKTLVRMYFLTDCPFFYLVLKAIVELWKKRIKDKFKLFLKHKRRFVSIVVKGFLISINQIIQVLVDLHVISLL